jgi:hypothetical protein
MNIYLVLNRFYASRADAEAAKDLLREVHGARLVGGRSSVGELFRTNQPIPEAELEALGAVDQSPPSSKPRAH